jgi:hypothetical protein
VRPNKIRVLGKDYSVKFTAGEPVHDDAQGHCDYLKLRISIREGLAPAEERSTLLHEALHCVSHAMGLHLSESRIERLETGILALLKDNPQLVAYLTKKG